MDMRLALSGSSVAQMELSMAYPLQSLTYSETRSCYFRRFPGSQARLGFKRSSGQLQYHYCAPQQILGMDDPNPAPYASLFFRYSHSLDHDFAETLACVCDADFEDAFPSDCGGPSSMAFTSRK